MEAANFRCMSMLPDYKTTRCHMPKDHSLDTHCFETSHMITDNVS
jgi:hypothetical protein